MEYPAGGTELQRSLREAKAISDIAFALSETEHVGLNDVLQLIVNSAKELISNVEQAVIHLLNEEEGTLTYGAVIGFDNPAGGKKKMHVGEGIAGQVVLSGETVNITDVMTDPRFVKLDKEPTYRSLMVTPVHSGERKLGTISVSSNLPFAFNASDRNLLSQLGTKPPSPSKTLTCWKAPTGAERIQRPVPHQPGIGCLA